MQIYLARNNVQAGPYSLDQVNQMLSDGQVIYSDLMWHEGMENWQTVGEKTGNMPVYNPSIITRLPPANPVATPEPEKPNTATTSWLKKDTILNKAKTGMDVSHARKQLDLAPIGSRVVAKLIDILLMLLASLPLYLAIYHSPNFAKLMELARSGTMLFGNNEVMKLMADIPSSTIILTDLMIFGLLIAQLMLLLRRGQSIGKMAMGIRILDINSNAIPSFTNLILLRTILPSVVYTISLLGQLFLLADFITIFTNPNKQSIHDKIAKTYVVRADDTQTTPLELEPTE